MHFAAIIAMSLPSGYALPARHGNDGKHDGKRQSSTYQTPKPVQTNPTTSGLPSARAMTQRNIKFAC
jgi:hypothetical protein